MHSNCLVSIVIRSYNEEQHIGKLLIGIIQQTIKDVEIILVDSGSTDSTLAIASRFPVKILSIEPEKFSFGRALNIGCQEAKGEFIAIASAHVYPLYKDWLEHLIAPFKNTQIGLVYGKQQGNEITKYSEHQVFSQWFSEQSNLNQNHPFCNNANAAIRRSLWEKVPYDETLTGLEDIDWAKQIMRLEYKIAYVAEAPIIHVHDETLERIYNRYRREALALKDIFPQEYFNWWDLIRLLTFNIASDYYHALRDGILWKNLFSITTFRLMQFWGTYQGFTQNGTITKKLRKTFYYPRSLLRPMNTINHNSQERIIEYTKQEEILDQVY